MSTEELELLINEVYENRDLLNSKEGRYKAAIIETIALLDSGKIRVSEKKEDKWVLNEWVKKGILLYFVIAEMKPIEVGLFHYHDKIPLKTNYKEANVRVVPPGTARYGSFLGKGTILLPGYVNIGAYVGEGTMIDTWATVGSGAQVGAHVHLSGGVGIGGVLEPLQAQSVIIEDGAFIGSRSIIVEGVIVEEEAVLGANVVLTASTPIIDVSGAEPITYRGRVPKRSVVIPGTTKKTFPAGEYDVSCALIIGKRKESTDRKTALNETLRAFSIGG